MRRRQKNILIAGCGRFGSNLAGILSKNGYNVIVIDKDTQSFKRLPYNFSGFEMPGDATDIDILTEAGISDTGTVVVATENDNVNCMIAQIASQLYNVEEVFVRLNDPEKGYLIEDMNIQPIYPSLLSISEFQRLSTLSLLQEEV